MVELTGIVDSRSDSTEGCTGETAWSGELDEWLTACEIRRFLIAVARAPVGNGSGRGTSHVDWRRFRICRAKALLISEKSLLATTVGATEAVCGRTTPVFNVFGATLMVEFLNATDLTFLLAELSSSLSCIKSVKTNSILMITYCLKEKKITVE